MDRAKAISKIRKCLALAKGGEPGEAGNALRQAQAMMREHGLDEADVQLADVCEQQTDARMQTVTRWEADLAALIAEAFACSLYTSARFLPSRSARRVWVFVGVDAAPQIAMYAMDVLSRQCAKARLQHIAKQPASCKPITKTARGDAFASAWVIGVRGLVRAQARSVRHEDLLLTYMARNHPAMSKADVKDRAVGRNVRDESREAGYAAGRAAQLSQGLAGAAETRRLG